MARIRSTHPGQWNDDDFLECSAFARLLALALRNFSDDNGIFEWKPKQIKRNCLPADSCDVLPLLSELAEHNQVRKFTVDGKDYGAIRNFRPWQRPKTPKSVYPCPPSIRKYVGLSDSESGNEPPSRDPISEIEEDDGDGFPKSTEQREEGGDSREEIHSELRSGVRPPEAPNGHAELPGKVPKPKEPEGFAAFYAAFPLKKSRGAALKAWPKAVAKALVEEIVAGAKRYAASRQGEDPQFTKHPASWLNSECWADELPLPSRPPLEKKMNGHHAVEVDRDARFDAAVRRFKERGIWLSVDGAPPGDPQCCAPRAVLERYGYHTPTPLAAGSR